MSMSSKTNPFSLELFSSLQLAGLIEEHLNKGPSRECQVLKSTNLPSQVPA